MMPDTHCYFTNVKGDDKLFQFSRKIASWAWLLKARLKLKFHWNTHGFNLARSLLNPEVAITEPWITKTREESSAKSLDSEDKPTHKSWMFTTYSSGPRMISSGTSALTLIHVNATLFSYLSKIVSNFLIRYPISCLLVIYIQDHKPDFNECSWNFKENTSNFITFIKWFVNIMPYW